VVATRVVTDDLLQREFHSKYGFKPSDSNWRSWTKYNFRSNVDYPGNWRFVVKLDGEKILEKTLYVGD
ncbi:MAG: DUF3859 domain-containing protein, partial [Pseudomonadales bacterium]|nr:DUF3859 domain-containing protein [Pseudomonadales bacterium]